MSNNPDQGKLDTPHVHHQSPGGAKFLQEQYRSDLLSMNSEIDASVFLQKFLPFSDSHASTLLEEMKTDGLYSDSGWTGLPRGTKQSKQVPSVPSATTTLSSPALSAQSSNISDAQPATPALSTWPDKTSLTVLHQEPAAPKREDTRIKEVDLYKPFVKIANKIAERAPAISAGLPEPTKRLQGQWVDTHDRALASKNEHANGVFPDIAFLSNFEADNLARSPVAPTVDTSIDTVYMVDPPQVSGGGDKGVAASGSPSPSTESTVSRLWLHAFTIVEVKSGPNDSLAQLAVYVRQIFMEQLDRLFVLAFTFNLPLLRVHLFDRSGVISSTGIDIHKSPKEFISAIAAFSCRTADELGWDPTVRVWDQKKVMHSYTAPMKGYSSTYDVPWVFEGFAKSGQSDPPQYVFIRSETLQDATRLWGRATLAIDVVLRSM
ncbi:hypothetical protein NP233_g11495 [Leucocoprinus birnbaumii]|uniref:Fungal-type protein kinase domain-containing protein n=1 Tax=Leucocoprinus birnbaumii TaxID=56174 RepID=A0AAD5VIC7_9AGAR|nr:hypothetical protein NP233_g11495 [Leucocoprinus birnbaumii]